MNTIINNISTKEKRRRLRKHQTPHEEAVWFLLRGSKVGAKWRRQVGIGPYIADFYCRKKQLVIEIDGAQHADQTDYDKERERYFLSMGIRTLRFWNHEILSNMARIEKLIIEAMRDSSGPDTLRINYFGEG